MRKFKSTYCKVSNGVRQGGVLSPKRFAVYIVDLSQDLAICKSGCYVNEHFMNHVMYADDSCHLAPSFISLQRMLGVYFKFSIRNTFMFNPIKSVCAVFKPKNNKIYCPTVSLDCDILKCTVHTKYLGFTFNMNVQYDDDMLRQVRTLIIVQTLTIISRLSIIITLIIGTKYASLKMHLLSHNADLCTHATSSASKVTINNFSIFAQGHIHVIVAKYIYSPP